MWGSLRLAPIIVIIISISLGKCGLFNRKIGYCEKSLESTIIDAKINVQSSVSAS